MKKLFVVLTLVLGISVLGIVVWINYGQRYPEATQITPTPTIEDQLPRYSLLPPLASYPVRVEATGSSFVRVNRQGDRGVYDGMLEAVEAEYLESSPGAKLSMGFSGFRVIVQEKTGVLLTRLRDEDTMLALTTGTIDVEGSGSGRISIQAGDLLLELGNDEFIDISVAKEEKTIISIKRGTITAAYVDTENETQVMALEKGDTGVFTNGELRVK